MSTAPVIGRQLLLVSHALCPYVQRAVITLREKGRPFERVDIDLANKPDWFLALNPLGKTPVLLVPDGQGGATPIFESAVICEYLDETLSPRLHPDTPLQRARHRAWIELASATLQQIGQYYMAKDEDAFAARERELALRFQQLEAELQTEPWFAGSAFSLVDAAFAPVFRYFEVFEQFHASTVLAHSPKAAQWAARLLQRDSVKLAVGPNYAELLRLFVERKGGVLGARSQQQRRAAMA